MELNIATAPRRNSPHWKQSTITWDEIITWMIDPADKKEAGNYILGTLRETEQEHRHAPGQTCTDLHRCKEAIVTRDALMLDADFPAEDFVQRVKDLKVKALVHTTYSSTPESPRYRVIIPLSRPLSPFEYESAATQVMDTVGVDSFDAGSSQPERYMFKPAGEHFDFWVCDGPVMEPPAASVEDILSRNLLPHSKRSPFDLPGVVGAFNRVYTTLDQLIEQFDLPYEPAGGRWRFKGTESAPGMDQINDGLWWSDHATDPAAGHAQSAFDLVRIHVFGGADATAKPDTAINDLPSTRKMMELAEADTAVRNDQLQHDFGPTSPIKTLGYDTDSHLDDDITRNLADRGLREKFRFVVNRGWLRWDGRVWAESDSIELWEPISEAVRTLVEEWMTMGKNNGQLTKLKSFLDVPKMKRVIENLKAVLMIRPEELDSHHDLLNCANGTVDLRTGQLQAHRREDYLTTITETPYVPGARHNDWDQVLSAIRPDVLQWMKLRCGQAATGWRVPDDVVPILQGGGANGKTTFTGAVMTALGGYARILSERAVFNSQGDHPTELMSLQGARFALLEETPEGVPLNVKRLKDVLGAQFITARRMRQDEETFAATHSLFMTTNYHPTVTETDEGTWRRLALVDFPYTYRPGAEGENAREGDPHLRYRMEESPTGQHEAVLAWLVDGAVEWYANDRILPEFPPSVAENMRVWRATSDPLQDYLHSELAKDPAAAIQVRDLYDDFAEWQLREGHPLWNERTFASRFRQHEGVKSMGVVEDRMSPAAKNSKRTLSRRDPMEPMPAGQVRVWAGVRFA